jgi:hypothetical protein|tara:strand:+ start:1986 stop:2273 length:288 start_codon:yes stop_codon:yes gene_type:complete
MTEEQIKKEEEEGDSHEKSPIEKAEAAAAKMEEQNKIMAENIQKLQELKANQILSGSADAGQTPAKKVPMTEIQYAEALQRGEVDPFKADGIEGY